MIGPLEMTAGTETSIRATAEEPTTVNAALFQPTREQLRTLLREIEALRKIVAAADIMRCSALTGTPTMNYDTLRRGQS